MKWTEQQHNRTTDLEKSFLIQRRGMAILASLFPVFFLVSSFVLQRTKFQTSMSAYYWTLSLERNVFVGTLCAVGVFLLLYKGYTLLEDRLLDVAGVCAVGVALCPMSELGDCNGHVLSLHGAFASVFFGCIFASCLMMSKRSLDDVADAELRTRFHKAYRLIHTIMIGSVAVAVLSRLLPAALQHSLCEAHALFWFEAVGVWCFGAYWYIKTRELDPTASWAPFMPRKTAAA